MNIVTIACLVAVGVVGAPAAVDAPAFSLSAVELRELAMTPIAGAAADAGTVFAVDTLDVDATGAAPATVWHTIHILKDEEAIEELGAIEVAWSPWAEERPLIRARVVTATGREHQLDPSTLIDGVVGLDEGVYSDRHLLQGPLPAMGVGAVVELEVRRRDLPGRLMPFAIHRFVLGGWSPAALNRLTVLAPTSTPLRHALTGGGSTRITTSRDVVGSTTRTRFELRDWPGVDDDSWEPLTPPALDPTASVSASTTDSWRTVATAYGAIVEAQLKGFDGSTWLTTWGVDTKAARAVVMQQILTKVAAATRYTGLEVGDAALTPRRPEETLSRGYGDCKDLATLTVGLFRAAGIDADVALVRAARDVVEPAVPGSSRFNHAIVAVSGKTPLWIDVTDPHARPGDVDSTLQGKDALIAAKRTRELTRLPVRRAADNRYREVRTITLADDGAARIVETDTGFGTFGSVLAGRLQRGEPGERLKEWQRYADDTWLAKGPVVVVETAGDGDRVPYELTLTVDKGGRGFTERASAVAFVAPRQLVDWLPSMFTTPTKKPDPKAPTTTAPKPRRSPVAVPMLMDVGVQYRIVPPAGFAMPALAPPRDEKWGPATYREHWRVEGNVLVIDFAFVLDTQTLTADEATTLQTKALAWIDGVNELVTFPHVAAKLIADGKVKEGIAAYRALIERSPSSAAERERLASQLLALKLGDAARREARKAVSLEPDRAEAHALLASVLAHDIFGRWRGEGADDVGAIRAARRAVELRPDDVTSLRLLADLIAFDAAGRVGVDVDVLKRAGALLQRIPVAERTELDTGRLSFIALMTGDFAGAGKLVPTSAAASRLWNSYREHGAARARAEFEASTRESPERSARLAEAGGALLLARHYADARTLLAGLPTTKPELLQFFASVGRCEDMAAGTGAAVDLVKRALRDSMLGGADAARSLWSPRAGSASRVSFKAHVDEAIAGVPAHMSSAFACDVAMGNIELSDLDDGAGGHHVVVTYSGDDARRAVHFFVVTEGGRPRLFAVGADVRTLGLEIFARSEREPRVALVWLKQLDELLGPVAPTADPLDGLAFRAVLQGSTDDDDVRLAAALVALDAPAVREAAAAHVAARLRRAGGDGLQPRTRALVQRTLAMTWGQLGKADEADALYTQLAAVAPTSDTIELGRLLAAQVARRYDVAEPIARRRLTKNPADFLATKALAEGLFARGDVEGSIRERRRLTGLEPRNGRAWNELAWSGIFAGVDRETLLKDAETAVALSPTYGARHTLATVQALQGNVAGALSSSTTMIQGLVDETPTENEWLIVALVAEALGMERYAMTIFARAIDPADTGQVGSARIARDHQRALAARGVAPLP